MRKFSLPLAPPSPFPRSLRRSVHNYFIFRIAILLINRLSLATTKPRTPNTIGLFSSYDGNIIGGLLLGVGMALTGACPGTVLPQVATGVKTGPLILLGGILGGILYSKFGRGLQTKVQDRTALDKPTVHQTYGFRESEAILAYEAFCATVLGTVAYFAPGEGKTLVPAVVGGVFIGCSQAASLLLTGNTLGISGAFEQVGDLFWWALDTLRAQITGGGAKGGKPSVRATAFAAGTLLGSWALSRVVDIPELPEVGITTVRAVIGGTLMVFGSRLAGGCTSGHGISGMSQLSISSIISVAGMFAGGMGLAAVLR